MLSMMPAYQCGCRLCRLGDEAEAAFLQTWRSVVRLAPPDEPHVSRQLALDALLGLPDAARYRLLDGYEFAAHFAPRWHHIGFWITSEIRRLKLTRQEARVHGCGARQRALARLQHLPAAFGAQVAPGAVVHALAPGRSFKRARFVEPSRPSQEGSTSSDEDIDASRVAAAPPGSGQCDECGSQLPSPTQLWGPDPPIIAGAIGGQPDRCLTPPVAAAGGPSELQPVAACESLPLSPTLPFSACRGHATPESPTPPAASADVPSESRLVAGGGASAPSREQPALQQLVPPAAAADAPCESLPAAGSCSSQPGPALPVAACRGQPVPQPQKLSRVFMVSQDVAW